MPNKQNPDAQQIIQRASENTVAKFKDIWLANLKANWDKVRKSQDPLILRNSFKLKDDVPAIILGAGESLDIALPHLQELKNRALILCADRSLKAVTKYVKPDIVATIDPLIKVGEYFKDIDSTGIMLCMSVLQHPSVWEKWKGDLLFYLQGVTPTVPEIDQQYQYLRMNRFRTWIPPLSGVTGILCSLAYEIGCQKVLLAGVDFAFREADYGDPDRSWDKAKDEHFDLKRYWAFAKSISREPIHFGHDWKMKISDYEHLVTKEKHWTSWEMIYLHTRAVMAFSKKLQYFSISPFKILEPGGVPHGTWEEMRLRIGYKQFDIQKLLRRPKRMLVKKLGSQGYEIKR